MNIPPQFQWTPGEAATVNEFLNTPVGHKWLSILIMRKPQLDLSNTEKAALSGAYAAGYESFLGQIGWSRQASKPDDDAAVKGIDPTKD